MWRLLEGKGEGRGGEGYSRAQTLLARHETREGYASPLLVTTVH